MSRFIAVVAICVLAITSAACNKETPVSTGKLTGDLSGKVELLDYDPATLYVTNNSGVNVTIEGTNYKAVTDSSGLWTIHLLPTGTYNLTFSKEGFSTYKVFGQQLVGGGEAYLPNPVRLAHLPTEFTLANFRIDSIISRASYVTFRWRGDLQPGINTLPNGYVSLGVVVVKDSSLLSDPTLSTNPNQFFSEQNLLTSIPGQPVSPYATIQYSGDFKKGERIYIAPYIGWRDSHAQLPDPYRISYYDPTRGVTVNPAIRSLHSNVVSMVLP